MYLNEILASPGTRKLAAMALLLTGAAVLMLAVLPADVWAEAGGAAGASANAATEGAKNFKKNGLSSVEAVGAVVFACVAIFSIARGRIGGKAGQGMLGFGLASLGRAVAVSPEATMTAIGAHEAWGGASRATWWLTRPPSSCRC